MPFYSLVVLALLQGITEFLPVSSSAHLVLWHEWAGPGADDLQLDIAVHVGTLAAVTVYFRGEVAQALRGMLALLRGRNGAEARLALNLAVATLPVGVAGAVIYAADLTDALRSFAVIGWAMILFGLILWWLDRRGGRGRPDGDWQIRDALAMGLWQALALIPGVSRSGAAISGGLAQGFERAAAARLAMLMSIPTITATGLLLVAELIARGDARLGADVALAAGLSFLAGLAALAGMLRLLRTVGYTPYVVYRVALGVILLIVAYS